MRRMAFCIISMLIIMSMTAMAEDSPWGLGNYAPNIAEDGPWLISNVAEASHSYGISGGLTDDTPAPVPTMPKTTPAALETVNQKLVMRKSIGYPLIFANATVTNQRTSVSSQDEPAKKASMPSVAAVIGALGGVWMIGRSKHPK